MPVKRIHDLSSKGKAIRFFRVSELESSFAEAKGGKLMLDEPVAPARKLLDKQLRRHQ